MEPTGNRLARAGAAAGLAIGIGYIAIIALYVPMGPPPRGVEERLAYLAANDSAWRWIIALSVLTDVLFLPLAFALYEALKAAHRAALLLAVTCIALFVVLDLSLTWTNYAVMLVWSGELSAATETAARAVVVAWARYPAAVLESGLLFVYNTLTLAVGILLAGIAMRGSRFAPVTAWTAIATGVCGIVAVGGPYLAPALSGTIIVTSVLTTLWVMLAGWDLLRRR